MNAKRLLLASDVIETPPEGFEHFGFNMGANFSRSLPDRTGRNCTIMLGIAGWAAFLAGYHVERVGAELDWIARLRLDLDWQQAEALFCAGRYCEDTGKEPSDITTREAINVLRYAAREGHVHWTQAQTLAHSRGA
jgi:hypothetical protein